MPQLRDFPMPDLGEGLTEGEIVHWLVEVGDVVTVDQPVAEISTEKAVVQVPIPFAGRVTALHGAAGDRIPVGSPLISIEVATAASEGEAASGNVLVGYGTNEAVGSRRRRITRADIERAAERSRGSAPAEAPAGAVERRRLTGVDRVAAERLTRSHREAAAATAWLTADATALMELRGKLDARDGAHVTPFAVLLRLCVLALRQFPRLNAHFETTSEEVLTFDSIHLGVAVQTDRGLVVPVIRDAQRLTVLELAAELERVAGAARDGRIEAAELSGSTFTVSNFGAFGVDGGTAIINPPEAAILGVGQIIERPWVAVREVLPRTVVELSLVFDHRVVDGAVAGGFLRRLGDLVEDPRGAIDDQ